MYENITQIQYSLYTPEEMLSLKEVVVVVMPTTQCSVNTLLEEARKFNPTTIIVKFTSHLDSDENIMFVSSTDLDKMAVDLEKKRKAQAIVRQRIAAISWEVQNRLHTL